MLNLVPVLEFNDIMKTSDIRLSLPRTSNQTDLRVVPNALLASQ